MSASWTISPTERPGAFLVTSPDGRDQSHVDLEDPAYLAFDYVRRLGDVLDLAAEPARPLRAVHIGGAGLTLPRYVAATRPGSHQIVLEPDEEITTLVREVLPLPRRSGIRVRPLPGAAGVRALPDDSADVIVLDAFVDGEVPVELLGPDHVAQVARVLRPSGWYVLNLVGRAPFPGVRRSVATVRAVLPEVLAGAEPATLRGRRSGNIVLVASMTPLPVAGMRGRAETSPAPYRVLDAGRVSDTLGGGLPW